MKPDDFVTELRKLEKQVGVLVSKTEPDTKEREILIKLLNYITELIGDYIVQK